MRSRLTTNDFIKRSILIHGDKYDYSIVDYINIDEKVEIICPEHGVFKQKAYHHLKGHGCKECSGHRIFNTNRFIFESNKIHNYKYDYSLVNYINSNLKIKIICPIHGIFEQIPHSHLNGKGCKLCGNNTKKSLKDFIEESKKVHGDKYDYSLVEYINNKIPVKIICQKHGVFLKSPKTHVHNISGCPSCCSSKGEEMIRLFMDENKIRYKRWKSLPGCVYKLPLRFDFYLPEHNTCIEFDGDQHYYNYGKDKYNKENLEIRKLRDTIKNKYCKENEIKLIRIRNKNNIQKKLNSILYNEF